MISMMHIMLDGGLGGPATLSMTSLQSGNTLQHRLVILAQGHANVLCLFQELRANDGVAIAVHLGRALATPDGRSCPRGPGPQAALSRTRLPWTAVLQPPVQEGPSCTGGAILQGIYDPTMKLFHTILMGIKGTSLRHPRRKSPYHPLDACWPAQRSAASQCAVSVLCGTRTGTSGRGCPLGKA